MFHCLKRVEDDHTRRGGIVGADMGQDPEGNQPWVFPLPSKVRGSSVGIAVGIETFWKCQT